MASIQGFNLILEILLFDLADADWVGRECVVVSISFLRFFSLIPPENRRQISRRSRFNLILEILLFDPRMTVKETIEYLQFQSHS